VWVEVQGRLTIADRVATIEALEAAIEMPTEARAA
jgi:hypothetical protein